MDGRSTDGRTGRDGQQELVEVSNQTRTLGFVQQRKSRHALPRELYIDPEVYR